MRSGAYAAWSKDSIATLLIRFFNNGARIVINLQRIAMGTAELTKAMIAFRSDNPADGFACLDFVHELDGFALQRIAEILGPLPTEVLPPPY
jgi:hypothetical protein